MSENVPRRIRRDACLAAGSTARERGWKVSLPAGKSTRRTLVFAVILVGGMVAARPALAHKSFIFATIPQKNIEGEVYFNGGEPGRNVTVMVLDPAGSKLGEVKTDENGRFTFEPRVRCDHQLIADDGLGHRAEYTVKADELPSALPALDAGDAQRKRDQRQRRPLSTGTTNRTAQLMTSVLPPQRNRSVIRSQAYEEIWTSGKPACGCKISWAA